MDWNEWEWKWELTIGRDCSAGCELYPLCAVILHTLRLSARVLLCISRKFTAQLCLLYNGIYFAGVVDVDDVDASQPEPLSPRWAHSCPATAAPCPVVVAATLLLCRCCFSCKIPQQLLLTHRPLAFAFPLPLSRSLSFSLLLSGAH